MENRVCSLLGIEYPIIQGAMSNVSDGLLAAAMAEAGGIGILQTGGARTTEDWLRSQIRMIKERTDKPFGVNLLMLAPNVEQMVDLVCEEGVPVVTTGGGNPAPYIGKLKENGIKVMCLVPSARVAKKMEAAGADAVIAEGMESGGYIGTMTTLPLVLQVVDAVDIPVIAAGGIADGRGMAAAFALGAEGVQMGTRFLAASECTLSKEAKAAVVASDGTNAIVIGNRIGHRAKQRLLRTAFTDEVWELEASKTSEIADYDAFLKGAPERGVGGDLEHGMLSMGQCAGCIHEVKPVKEILQEIDAQFRATINGLYARQGG